MIIGSSNSALNVEEEAEKSVKVQTREEKKKHVTRMPNSGIFWSLFQQTLREAKRGFKKQQR